MLWGMLGGFGGAEVEVDSDSEWFLVRSADDAGTEGTIETDGALEDLKDFEALDMPEANELDDANAAPPCVDHCEQVAPPPVKTWAEVVKSPALVAESPPVRPAQAEADPGDFDLDAPKPSFVLADGPCELSEKDLATAKYSRRCKDRSFGHTMRAKQVRPADCGIFAVDETSPSLRGARKASAEICAELGADMELAGPMKFAQASALAGKLGGTVQVCKGKAGRNELLNGAQLSVVELQADGASVKYVVKEELPKSKRSRRVRSSKCPGTPCEWRSASLAKHKKDECRAALREALHG